MKFARLLQYIAALTQPWIAGEQGDKKAGCQGDAGCPFLSSLVNPGFTK
ncbi:MAG: hypothetical protein OES90_09790 [Xanthomonadales bacterium]|nr:hypothetical protein [Xanthomonadales bacterium]